MRTIDELKLEGDDFWCEEYKKHWKGIESRLKQKYGITSLIDYLEDKLKQGISRFEISKKLGIEYTKLCIFTAWLERQPEGNKTLTDLLDIMDLDVKDLSGLLHLNNRLHIKWKNKWQKIEDKIRQKYKAPSLPAYLIYEHHFNERSITELSEELEVSEDRIRYVMRSLGIPTRGNIRGKHYQSKLDKWIKKKHNCPLQEYLETAYWRDNLSLGEIAKKIRVSRQAVHYRMKVFGIKRRKNTELVMRGRN